MWLGASPEDPRSSAIGLLLSRRTTLLPPLPFRGEGWGGGRGRTSLRHQRVHLLWREVVVVPMVEPHHRRVLARAQALDLFVAEKSIRRNLIRRARPDLLFHVVDDLVGSAQRTAQIGADVE